MYYFKLFIPIIIVIFTFGCSASKLSSQQYSFATKAEIDKYSLSAPTPVEIEEAADLTDQELTEITQAGSNKSNSLNNRASTAIWIGKLSQYVGGAGAVLFGLSDAGGEAATGGAIVALGTIIEQGINPNAKKAQAESCTSLSQLNTIVKKQTISWRFLKNDSEFQNEFQQHYDDLWQTIIEARDKCGI